MRDMEMLQFHPTGLIVPGSVVAGSLLEEGLRGAGAYLLNGDGERYMQRYAPERGRARHARRGQPLRLPGNDGRPGLPRGRGPHRGGPPGRRFRGEQLSGHVQALPPVRLRPRPGRRAGVALGPLLHGRGRIDPHAHASLHRLFVAGEDAGGVHGGNRLGGNGICESCVYGRQAGKALAAIPREREPPRPATRHPGRRRRSPGACCSPSSAARAKARSGCATRCASSTGPRSASCATARTSSRPSAASPRCAGRPKRSGSRVREPTTCPGTPRIDLRNMLDVSLMTASSALARRESRAAHYRSDHPQQDDANWLYNIFLTRGADGMPVLTTEPVRFTHKSLEECQRYRK